LRMAERRHGPSCAETDIEKSAMKFHKSSNAYFTRTVYKNCC
jgi:hypothetical protein